jgi:DNA uptake protein ComE-like DNA-binding protein
MRPIPEELIPLLNKNDGETQLKIKQLLNTPPSDSDGEGFVYGHNHPDDRNLRSNFYVKLGRTEKKNPEERVLEWGGDMVFCQKSSFNRRFERLVHLFFNYVNITRDIDGKKQVEWFHFTEKTNVPQYVAAIQDLVEETYKDSNFYFENSQQSSNQKIVNWEKETRKVKSFLININTASKSELMLLPGIGQLLSDRIINYRDGRRRFIFKTDIMNVPYIKGGRYGKLKDFITC